MSTFKKCQVVMLPTNEKANLLLTQGKLYYCSFDDSIPRNSAKNQHVYILSDEEIKEGDWYLDRDGFYPKKVKKLNDGLIYHHLDDEENLYFDRKDEITGKVIATTDDLIVSNSTPFENFQTGSWKKQYLPKPSQSFIEKYVEQYNKGNQITEVMVEYKKFCDRNCSCNHGVPESESYCYSTLLVSKVNPKDNTITIKKVKDSWSREEVIRLLEKYLEDLNKGKYHNQKRVYLDKWIEENLYH